MNRILRAARRPHWMATLLMCTALSAALSACGGSDDNASSGTQAPSGGSQTPGSVDNAVNQPPAVKPAIRCAP